MTRRMRLALAMPALVLLTAVLVWGATGLPHFGDMSSSYAHFVTDTAGPRRHVTNVVTAVLFDFRGLDTMVEEFILFSAVLGTTLMLRSTRDVAGQRPRDQVDSEALRFVGSKLAPMTLLFGLWVVSFGYVTPGGGFQGGVALASGALLIWLTGSYREHRVLTPTTLIEAVEGTAAAAYVGVGLAVLAGGAAFLANTFPLGTSGTLASGGTIAVLNWVAGVAVAAAMVLLFHEFLEEHVLTLAASTAEEHDADSEDQ